jgi:2-polyprenyl-3-methyl-5-hydroxy-6-metoxy-1,4-benzoquinol methylase
MDGDVRRANVFHAANVRRWQAYGFRYAQTVSLIDSMQQGSMPTRIAASSRSGDAIPCIACGSTSFEPWPAHQPPDDQPLLVCTCGLGRVREMPTADIIAGYYQDDYYRPDGGRRFAGTMERLSTWFKRRRARRIAAMLPAGSALDVGCERGVFLDELRRFGWQVSGTQLSRPATDSATTELGLDVRYGELPSLNFRPDSFSLATYFHVLEHLPRPGLYLAETRRLLARDGLLVVEVPNFEGLTARLFGRHWFGLDLPRHLYHFSPRSLAMLLAAHGFSVVKVSYFSAEYSVFVVLQTILNAILRQRDVLAEPIRRSGRPGSRIMPAWDVIVLAGLLAVPALLWTVRPPWHRPDAHGVMARMRNRRMPCSPCAPR